MHSGRRRYGKIEGGLQDSLVFSTTFPSTFHSLACIVSGERAQKTSELTSFNGSSQQNPVTGSMPRPNDMQMEKTGVCQRFVLVSMLVERKQRRIEVSANCCLVGFIADFESQ